MVEKTLRRVGLATLFFISGLITVLSVDWVVNPIFSGSFSQVWWGYRGIVVSIFSIAGSGYVYWFGGLLNRIIIEYEDKGQTADVLTASSRRWDRIKAYFIVRHKRIFRSDNKWTIRIKRYGYPIPFVVGIVPELLPLARTTVISFCAGSKWRSGFALYLVSDLFKNIGMSALWSTLFHH